MKTTVCKLQRSDEEKKEREMKRNYIVKISFHLSQCRGKVQLCPARYFLQLHGVPLSLFSLLVSSPLFFLLPPFPLPPLRFLPSLIPKAEWQPFISHQTHFMTAAALHSCWTVCLKGFLTRPWIRLAASHSLFLSAWLDSDADIKWTLMQSPSHPTHTTACLPLCVASKAAETASS